MNRSEVILIVRLDIASIPEVVADLSRAGILRSIVFLEEEPGFLAGIKESSLGRAVEILRRSPGVETAIGLLVLGGCSVKLFTIKSRSSHVLRSERST
ncbi:MAG: hypothetical protein QXP97_07705 [Desulfurococcus sp.]|uniref:hypothetical protein n=1 Tax=Desulfurococcus sp. TaxID=51678 RepID=UPI00316AA994